MHQLVGSLTTEMQPMVGHICQSSSTIKHDWLRLVATKEACCQLRTVVEIGLRTDKDGSLLGAHLVAHNSLEFVTDPVFLLSFGSHKAISAFSPFQDNVWPLLLHKGEETAVQLTSLILKHVTHDFDACGLKFGEPLACHERIGVVVAAYNLLYPFFDNKVGTRWRFAKVRTGL